MLVEPLKGCLKLVECVGGDDIIAGDIAELEECSECLDDIRGDEPLDGIQIYLNGGFSMSYILAPIAAYLHQSLGVVSCPLVEIPSLFESVQAGEWRSESNSVD